MSLERTRQLVVSTLVSREALGRALLSQIGGGANVLATLVDDGALSDKLLEGELDRASTPLVANVFPMRRACERLPAGLLRALFAVPVHEDPKTGVIEVAALDPGDPHVRSELAFHLGVPVRLVRAPFGLLRDALRSLERRQSIAPPPGPDRRKTPAYLAAPLSSEVAAMPVLVRHNSDAPIPLVRSRNSLPPSEEENEPIPLVSHPPPARETGEGAYALEAPRGPFPDPAPLLAAVRAAEFRDDVLDLLLNGVAMVAARAAIFAVKKGEVRGLRANEVFGAPDRVRELSVSLSDPSVFATASAAGHYLGPLPNTPAHRFIAALAPPRGDVAIVPVRAQGALALFLYADALGDTMIATKRMLDLAKAAGESFTRIVQRGPRSIG